ncbi:GTPase HflX [Rickettsiales endosymbiont of Stachyamoeba lipophora]|nr:GTPase HflX [Rickettsiales endosymbiont of Stachyamoeba lipophora]
MAEYKSKEAFGLARSIDLNVIDVITFRVNSFKPGCLLKKGKIEEIDSVIKKEDISLVYIDLSLTPVQQRNLEKAWNVKVIDRTGLIIEIFASRANTSEGKLQVRLAQLDYQKSRLVRLWTHLERQRGGLGNIGGPGETQIEADKRMIKEEMQRIRKQLEKVKTTRELHRKSREIVPYPVIAIVGYTNAGKSTLFNLLTKASVIAEDKLFATLDPTMRIVKLPSRKTVILSDTVGFISELPTQLIAAFRATLEEVIAADIILHVIDSTSPSLVNHIQNVEEILTELGIEEKWRYQTLHVYNKMDAKKIDFIKPIDGLEISALENKNIDLLLQQLDACLAVDEINMEITIKSNEGEKLAWIYRHANVISVEHADLEIKLLVLISRVNLAKWQAKYVLPS